MADCSQRHTNKQTKQTHLYIYVYIKLTHRETIHTFSHQILISKLPRIRNVCKSVLVTTFTRISISINKASVLATTENSEQQQQQHHHNTAHILLHVDSSYCILWAVIDENGTTRCVPYLSHSLGMSFVLSLCFLWSCVLDGKVM